MLLIITLIGTFLCCRITGSNP
ncbi:hypothetical protein NC651_033714 [Populus alba x Populus x berolinensis]|nr:hypothetical protein NC651_033714 [Populus alba x Populus x berolinensis]